MQTCENWGAINTPMSFDEKNKTINKDLRLDIRILQQIRDMAWDYSMKYRWDPVLSKTHAEYLTLLNQAIEGCKS